MSLSFDKVLDIEDNVSEPIEGVPEINGRLAQDYQSIWLPLSLI